MDEGWRFISIVVGAEPPIAQIRTVAGDVDHFVLWWNVEFGEEGDLELNRGLACRARTMESMLRCVRTRSGDAERSAASAPAHKQPISIEWDEI